MGRHLTARNARVASVAIIVIAIAATGFAQRFRLPGRAERSSTLPPAELQRRRRSRIAS